MKNKAIVLVVFASLAGRFDNLHGQAAEAAPVLRDAQATVTQSSTFKLPDPSGTFGIGRIGYEWIDASRPDRYSANPGDRRDLMVYLWYPSSRRAAGQTAPYWPGAKYGH
jgi:hypothetical protein